MSLVFGFLTAVILLLATGCAAPLSKVVSTRQGGTIDRQLFKKGDKVKVTYEDERAKMRTKKGRVLQTDDDSVTLDVGFEGPIALEYRRIHTFSHPIRIDRWFGGLSAGTFIGEKADPQGGLFFSKRFTGAGCTLRYAPYSNRAFEANLLMGGKGKGGIAPKWLGVTLSAYIYTIMPRTYLILGMGGVADQQHGEYEGLGVFRIGLGIENPLSKRFNIRIEAELLTGLRIYFEQRLR